MSNLEPRPASYTAAAGGRGVAETPLNNWDTVRSYGSAADDLECRYQPNDLRCCRDKVPNGACFSSLLTCGLATPKKAIQSNVIR